MNNLEKESKLASRVTVLNQGDLPQIMAVEQSAWDPEWQATEDKFVARIETFPKGAIGIFSEGQLVGTSTSMLFNFDIKEIENYHKSWDQITGNGYITTHNPEGNALYVVSVATHKNFQGQGLGRKLVEAQKELAMKEELDWVVLGARMPGFREHLVKTGKGELPVGDEFNEEAKNYLFLKRKDGKAVDPEIRFYQDYCGFKIGTLIADFGSDKASCNFGVLMFRNSKKGI